MNESKYTYKTNWSQVNLKKGIPTFPKISESFAGSGSENTYFTFVHEISLYTFFWVQK